TLHQSGAVARACALAVRLNRSDWVARLVPPFLAWLVSVSRQAGRPEPTTMVVPALEECVRALIWWGQLDALRAVLSSVETACADAPPPDRLLWQTPLAGGWLALHEPTRALPLLQTAEKWL